MCLRLQPVLLISVTLFSTVPASFPGSFDSRLDELPARLSQRLPEGLPQWLLRLYCPLHAVSESCLRDSKVYLSGLRTFQPWALRMVDASSKFPAGLMMGHVHDLGNFDQCFTTPLAPFHTQFCLVDVLGLTAPVRLAKPDAETTLGGLPLLKHPVLSFCLPASCSNTDVAAHFSDIVAPWNLTVKVDNYGCSKHDSPPLDSLDWMAVLVLCILSLLVISSTGYDIFYMHKVGGRSCCQSMLLSFSVMTNARRLCSTTDPQRSLAFLGGLRFLPMVWVILGHHCILHLLIPAVNWIVPYKELHKPMFSPLQNAPLAVDTFLVMTGMLIAYVFLQEVSTNNRTFRLLPFYMHRIIRVTPALAMVVLMGATLSSRVGDGPLWRTFFLRHQTDCRANGWTNLLFLNNYLHTDQQCASYTWYLCVDMHLYFLSPLVLFPLLKYKKFAKIGLPILISSATSIDFLVAYMNKLPAGSLITRDLRTADNYRLEYVTTHTRAAPWLIGIGLGYVLHSLKATKFKLSPMMVVLGWSVALTLAASSIFGISYFHQDQQVMHYNALQSSLYISLHRVAWALATAWLIFACETGYGGFVQSFLGMRIFQPLGRLAFTMYLVHSGLQYGIVASQRTAVYSHPLYMARDVLGELLLSIGLAIFLCLGVEAPFIRIEKALIQKFSVAGMENQEKKEATLATDNLEIDLNNSSKAEVTMTATNGYCDKIVYNSKL